MVLNRLATNALPVAWRPACAEKMLPLEVRLTPDGSTIRKPEDLITALVEKAGAEVDMAVVSRVTGFGLGANLPTYISAIGIMPLVFGCSTVDLTLGERDGRRPADRH
jgi:hypothetical protein